MLDLHADPTHNRMVLTFVGAPEAVAAAAFRCAEQAARLIDMTVHHGEHPSIGATDVIPFVPVAGVDAWTSASNWPARSGSDSARSSASRSICTRGPPAPGAACACRTCAGASTRRLREAIETDPDRAPDFGPARLGTAGATAVGARPFLVAYNVNLATSDLALAKRIARNVRESSGGLPAVQALGMATDDPNVVQVSMNLLDTATTPLHVVFEAVQAQAAAEGVGVAESEIVGLLPLDVLVSTTRVHVKARAAWSRARSSRHDCCKHSAGPSRRPAPERRAADQQTPGGQGIVEDSRTRAIRARDLPADDLRADVRYLGSLLGTVLRSRAATSCWRPSSGHACAPSSCARPEDVDLHRLLALVGDLDPSWRRRWCGRSPATSTSSTRWSKSTACARCGRGRWPIPTSRCASRSARRWPAFPPICRSSRSSAFLSELCVTPTFTAHPTESRRRTVLDLLARLGELVRLGDERPLTREEHDSREQRILEAITLLWQTEEVRPRRPTVLDEVQSVLSIVGPSVFAVAPALHAELARAFAARYPNVRPRAGRVLEVHSWVGGDRDGNPNVTPEVTRQTIGAAPDAGPDRLPAARRSAGPGSERRVDPGAGDPRAGDLAAARRRRSARDRRRAGAAGPDRAVPPEARVHRRAAAADAARRPGISRSRRRQRTPTSTS